MSTEQKRGYYVEGAADVGWPAQLVIRDEEVAQFRYAALANTVSRLLNDEYFPDRTINNPHETLEQVQDAQRAYDKDFWSHAKGQETICHSERHISKLAGKLATIAEIYDHGQTPDLTVLDKEIIPDLLIFAARLANDRNLVLSQVLNARTDELRQRYSQQDLG